MEITLRPSSGLQRLIDAGPAAVRAAISAGLNDAGKDLETAVKRKLRDNRSVKSGTLLRSIRYWKPDDLTVKVGSSFAAAPLVYAAQVEFGGPIPKSGSGRLAWPVSREYGGVVPTPAGVGGHSVQTARFELGATSTFVRPSKSGRTRILFFKGPQFGPKGYAPAFILANRVVQPGKPFLIPTVLGMTDEILAQLDRAIINANIGLGRS